MDSRILIPIRYAAWLSGDLGRTISQDLETTLSVLPGLRITRLPRGIMIEADEAPGPMVEVVHRGMADLEASVARRYPVFHHEMGPVWTGTLQVVFPKT